MDDFCPTVLEKRYKNLCFAYFHTNSFALIRESYAFIRKNFTFIRKSFAFIRESFAIICESFAVIRKSFEYFTKNKFCFPTKMSPMCYLLSMQTIASFVFKNQVGGINDHIIQDWLWICFRFCSELLVTITKWRFWFLFQNEPEFPFQSLLCIGVHCGLHWGRDGG